LLFRKAVDSNKPVRQSGTIKEYPVLGKHGVGLIRDDTTQKDVTFHARFLLTGHEDNLKPETRLSYTLCYSSAYDLQPMDISFENVQEQSGTLHTYNDDIDIGIIKADDDHQHYEMDFDSIIGRVPEKFIRGLRVTFTSHGNVATNVRFVGLATCCGRIKFYNVERKFGFIVPNAGGNDVVFTEASVLNIIEVHSESQAEILCEGAPVTYHLQRVPPMQREKYGKKALKGTNVCLQHPSLEVIERVIHNGPRDPLADIEPIALRSTQASQHEAREVEDAEQPYSESDPSLRSSYLGVCSLVHLSFSRSPPEFYAALDQLLDQHRNLSFRLACGAYIFAPSTCHASISAISNVLKLGPWDVIVTRELEASVCNSVLSLPRKYKISIKNCSSIHVQHEQEKERSEWWNITVKRTFVHVSIPSSGDGSTSSAATAAG